MMLPFFVFSLFFFVLNKNRVSSVLVSENYEKCSLWTKTDGSSCTANSFFDFQKIALNWQRTTVGEEICCPELNNKCFSIATNTPWECQLELPDCMDIVKPNFFVFTSNSTSSIDGTTIIEEPQSIDFFNLNKSVSDVIIPKYENNTVKPFYVIIHGYGHLWPLNWMFNIKDRLIALGYNVMIVQWTGGSSDELGYFKAAANTRTIGAAVAFVMKSLQDHQKISLKETTIIGFSLGSQVSGYAGHDLPGLRRIIGLDPAGPLFQCMHRHARLDPKDAHLVIAIHTHGDYFLMSGCGTLQQFGHMDFYVNGGVQQPGCKRGVPEAAADLASLKFDALAENVRNILGPACSHNRAPPLLVEFLDQMLATKSLSRENQVPADDHSTAAAGVCSFTTFPCPSTGDWLSGVCFDCPANGCPTLNLDMDLHTFRHGKYFFNTMAENVTTGRYCGRQLLISLTSAAFIKGRITLIIKDSNDRQSDSIIFQDMYDLLLANEEKSRVVIVPWELQNFASVDFVYSRNRLYFTGGPLSWSLISLSLRNVEGNVYSITSSIPIRDGKLTNIPLTLVQS